MPGGWDSMAESHWGWGPLTASAIPLPRHQPIVAGLQGAFQSPGA